jgi:hypothetical protein
MSRSRVRQRSVLSTLKWLIHQPESVSLALIPGAPKIILHAYLPYAPSPFRSFILTPASIRIPAKTHCI